MNRAEQFTRLFPVFFAIFALQAKVAKIFVDLGVFLKFVGDFASARQVLGIEGVLFVFDRTLFAAL